MGYVIADNRILLGDIEVVALADDGAAAGSPVVIPSMVRGRWLPYLGRHPWALSKVRVRPVRFRSYLVRSPGLTLVVDAGVGPATLEGEGYPPQRWDEARPATEEVDVVFLSHSHPVEAGWAFTQTGEPAFPGARHVAQCAEWDAGPARDRSRLGLLDELGVLDLVDGEEELAEGVVAVPTPGHSPGHQSLLLRSGDEQALLVGDAFAHPTQFIDPLWSSAQDEDGARAAWTRAALLDWLEADGVTVIASHFPAPGFGRLELGQDGRRFWRALPSQYQAAWSPEIPEAAGSG